MSVFLLVIAGILPVIVCAGFYLLDKKTPFKNLKYIIKQCIFGVVFGGLAILATEVFSTDVGNGTLLNVRDASPIICGLLMGGPAGIIAGFIGGAERALCILWGGGRYTVIACSVATALAGVFGFLCRKFMFANKNPSWFFAFLIALTTEVFHMLLIFLTNMTDAQYAFTFVKKVSIPMITANTLSVTVAAIVMSLISREKIIIRGKRTIAQIFETLLFACVLVAFGATGTFTYFLQDNIVKSDTERTLSMVAHDVTEDIREASDLKLLESARSVANELQNPDFKVVLDMFDELSDGLGIDMLFIILQAYADEINVVDTNGIIVQSTEDNIGFNMREGEQSAEFLCLLEGTDEYVQSYGPTAKDPDKYMKYAGKKLPDCDILPGGGFVQVGYNSDTYYKNLEERVKIAAENRHIGQSGYVLILNKDFDVVSAPEGHVNDKPENLGRDGFKYAQFETFLTEVAGESCYCQYSYTEGYYIVAVHPEADAMFPRDISVYILVFVEIIVFSVLFIFLYMLIKKRIVDNIDKVNLSLAQITGGNLDVVVDVRDGVEFSSLSDDINATVDTLKLYIEREAKRLDKELEFAQRIQLSALPSVFPPYPDHEEFDIFASMDAAKEVGGDFYDFYFAGPHKFVFMIADVSGKGIPAAMFMMTAKTHLRNMTESGMDIADVFTEVNRKLCENNAADMFVTAWMGAIDLSTGVLSYVNAGHNPPLIKQNGKFEYLRSKANFILAGMDMTRYKKQELQLSPGDEIFLYTDGVTEATNPEEKLFGEERLQNCLNNAESSSPTELCKKVKSAVTDFADSAPQFDDITMVAVKFNCVQKE